MLTVDLAALLRQGPVVIFFFPSAFTEGPECRSFADNLDRFRAAGVSVVGMSRDSVETLSRFSTSQCAGKVPLASASETIVNGFDVNDGAMFNTRTTFVIDTAGKIAFVHDADDPGGHAERALAFVQEGFEAHPLLPRACVLKLFETDRLARYLKVKQSV